MTNEFGPDAVATWANLVTVGRVLISPVLFVLINGRNGSWTAVVLWFLLCASDGVDGFIARRQGVTTSGAFLDPLADKILVLGAMFTLVSEHVLWIVPVAIIAVREVAISLYRTVVGAQGVSVPAKKLGKMKTVCQQFAVGFALMPLTAIRGRTFWMTLLWIAVVLTIVSGLQYLLAARKQTHAV